MTVILAPSQFQAEKIRYPDSDGEPMSDNTLQFDWITLLKHNLDILFADNPEVFVAGDLLWYPIEGDNKTRTAPDVMVAIGRPKGYRGSYKQWEENNQPPQVVFEVLSPGNRFGEMLRKLAFYEQHGVEEYYVYNPNNYDFTGFLRSGNQLVPIEHLNGFVSPRLGIRFETPLDAPLVVRYPNGKPFVMPVELAAENERVANENARLREKLRSLGIDPAAV